MTLRERIQLDLSRNDYGSARTRLVSAFVNSSYNPALPEEIARLSLQMHNPVEAGRWYFCCDSQDEQSAALIQLFTSKHASGPRQILSQVPVRLRSTPGSQLPERVRHRLAALGHRDIDALAHSAVQENKKDWFAGAVTLGCAAVLLLIVTFTIVGIVASVRWLINR